MHMVWPCPIGFADYSATMADVFELYRWARFSWVGREMEQVEPIDLM